MPLKARVVARDFNFMCWINANDCACVTVSLLQPNNIIVFTHANCYQFKLSAGSLVLLETKVKSQLHYNVAFKRGIF